MDTLAIDIETYSDVSLPDCGVHRYAASEQFEILLFASRVDAMIPVSQLEKRLSLLTH